jgi:urocanate hydratase
MQSAQSARDSGTNVHPDPASTSLGGKLLYVGELDQAGRALVVAGNVAGAASLSATADSASPKQAIRDGVVDFLVTSLDEALRILKNEVRKGETVAVCVGVAPEQIEREMRERGVQPDLLRQGASPGASSNPEGPSRDVQPETPWSRKPLNKNPMSVPALVQWRVDSAPARWLPKLDSIALDCLAPKNESARRWLRLAPRYLGRLAQGVRLVSSDREFAATFIERVRESFSAGEIQVPAQIQVSSSDGPEEYNFTPSRPPVS